MIRLLLLLSSCGPAPADSSPPWPEDPPTTLTPLEPGRLLRRLSLDLRGVLPSVEEVQAALDDPAAVDAARDAWLEDPRLEGRLVAMLGDQWHTRVDAFLLPHSEYRALGDDPALEYAFERAVGEEPLRLIARLAVEDRPYTEVVTADFTMAHPLTLLTWPLEALEQGEGWVKARYTDGRPAAGVLSTNGLWWRYYSTVSNLNRGRAAALSRLLLCEDLLSRPVSFAEGPALADAEGVEDALRSTPACQGCHAAVDPLAAALFGFWAANEYNVHEIDTYHLEREPLGEALIGSVPAFFGQPVSSLGELGQVMSDDPRLLGCAVQRSAEALWGRSMRVSDLDRLERLRRHFIAEGLRLKPLLSAVIDTPEYRAGGHAGSDAATLEAEATARPMGPALLASALEELTGFTWTFGGFAQLDNDSRGFRVLGGGVDGEYVTRAQALPGLTQLLVQRRAAEGAARAVVEADLQRGEGRLLQRVGPFTRPEEPAFDAQLQDLHLRLLGRAARAEDLDGLRALWTEVAAATNHEEAWVALLVVMMSGPEFGSR